jgi:hypothetical protein
MEKMMTQVSVGLYYWTCRSRIAVWRTAAWRTTMRRYKNTDFDTILTSRSDDHRQKGKRDSKERRGAQAVPHPGPDEKKAK